MWEALLSGLTGTLVGGVAASWVTLKLQDRQERKRGTDRAVGLDRAVERDRVVRFLEGQIAEISHSVSHIRSGDLE